jgi:hypothetical protein
LSAEQLPVALDLGVVGVEFQYIEQSAFGSIGIAAFLEAVPHSRRRLP